MICAALLISTAGLVAALGCGGQASGTSVSGTSDADANTRHDEAGACAIRTAALVSVCGRSTFDLVGPASACNPNPNGWLTAAQCLSICPMGKDMLDADVLSPASCEVDLDGGTHLLCGYLCPP
jgi:hypothetical protein